MLISFIEKNKKEIFFILLLLLFFYRSPFIFLNGRFMAEEGSLYFANAYKFNFFYSLIFVDFTSGYLNLWANISGIISNFFDLKFAPLISNYLALIPKIIIIFIILYNKSLLFSKFEHKILFCLLIFLSPANVPEIWLNSINSQIFFCIITFILIFIIFDTNRINYYYLFLIFLAGLTGIYSCILLPIFFFKYLIYKHRQDFANLLTILSCTTVQLTLVLYAKLSNILYEEKLHSINFDLIVNYIYNVLIKAFLGTSLTKYIYNNLIIEINLYILSAILIFLFFLLFIFFYNQLKSQISKNKKKKFVIFSCLYCLISTSLVVMVGGVSDYVGGRYAALPSFYLLAIILIFYNFFDKFRIKFFFLLLLFSSILTGTYEFRPSNHYLNFLDCNGCPKWENEVVKFQKDKTYRLKIWPYPKKNMSLN